MNKTTKIILWAWLIISIALSVRAQPQITVYWNFTNMVGENAALVSGASLTPLPIGGPFPQINGVYVFPNSNFFRPSSWPPMTNGTIQTNVYPGIAYQFCLYGPWGSLTVTNGFPLSLTNLAYPTNAGSFDLSTYLGFTNEAQAVTQLIAGTNVSIQTSAGPYGGISATINASGGGSGGGTTNYNAPGPSNLVNVLQTINNGPTNQPINSDLGWNRSEFPWLSHTLNNNLLLGWLVGGDSTGADTWQGTMNWMAKNYVYGIQTNGPFMGGNAFLNTASQFGGTGSAFGYFWESGGSIQIGPGTNSYFVGNSDFVPTYFYGNQIKLFYFASASNSSFASINYSSNGTVWYSNFLNESAGPEGTLQCTNISVGLTSWQIVLSNRTGWFCMPSAGLGLVNTNNGAGALIYDINSPGEDLSVWLGVGSNNILALHTNLFLTVAEFNQIKSLASYALIPTYISYLHNTNYLQCDTILGSSQMTTTAQDPTNTTTITYSMLQAAHTNNSAFVDYTTPASDTNYLFGLNVWLTSQAVNDEIHFNGSNGYPWKFMMKEQQLTLVDLFSSCGAYGINGSYIPQANGNGTNTSLFATNSAYGDYERLIDIDGGHFLALWIGNGNPSIADYTLGHSSQYDTTYLRGGSGIYMYPAQGNNGQVNELYPSGGWAFGNNGAGSPDADPGANTIEDRYGVFSNSITVSNIIGNLATFSGGVTLTNTNVSSPALTFQVESNQAFMVASNALHTNGVSIHLGNASGSMAIRALTTNNTGTFALESATNATPSTIVMQIAQITNNATNVNAIFDAGGDAYMNGTDYANLGYFTNGVTLPTSATGITLANGSTITGSAGGNIQLSANSGAIMAQTGSSFQGNINLCTNLPPAGVVSNLSSVAGSVMLNSNQAGAWGQNGGALTNLNAANLTGGPVTNSISTGAATISGNGVGLTNVPVQVMDFGANSAFTSGTLYYLTKAAMNNNPGYTNGGWRPQASGLIIDWIAACNAQGTWVSGDFLTNILYKNGSAVATIVTGNAVTNTTVYTTPISFASNDLFYITGQTSSTLTGIWGQTVVAVYTAAFP